MKISIDARGCVRRASGLVLTRYSEKRVQSTRNSQETGLWSGILFPALNRLTQRYR